MSKNTEIATWIVNLIRLSKERHKYDTVMGHAFLDAAGKVK